MTSIFDAVTCRDEGRRAAVLGGGLDGIDTVEVERDNQTTLHVFFLKGGVPAGMNHRPDLCRVAGGERVTNIHVLDTVLQTVPDLHLDVIVDMAGDFSTYTLTIAGPLLDPFFATVPFSFKAGCPSPFDCPGPAPCPEPPDVEPLIDYWVKDYAGFRQALLDWVAARDPNWLERSEADLGIALLDLFAYTADQLSDYQDRVANEMYLGTARQRVSVKRHSALIDYVMHQGANAHAFLQVQVQARADVSLPAGTQVTTVPDRNADPVVFETNAAVPLFVEHNRLDVYTWSNDNSCLPAGATQTYLDGWHPNLKPGEYLLFEEVKSPVTRLEADANRTLRQAVQLTGVARANDPLVPRDLTLVSWREEDAIQRSFCLTTRCADRTVLREVSVARGNVVPASHGRTTSQSVTVPEPPPTDETLCQPPPMSVPSAFSFDLDETPLTFTTEDGDPRDGQSTLRISSPPNEQWQERRTLLESGPFDRDFVVDVDDTGRATIRFGDGTYGRGAAPATVFTVTYRVGNGVAGNVGAEKLMLTPANLGPGGSVRNPLPASGGVGPESVANVQRDAPQAFRAIMLRAVTASDYARAAEKVPGVHRAVAHFRWTGSWHTVFVSIDPVGRTDLSEALKQQVMALLDAYRMADYDLEVRPPQFVSLDIAINVCVLPGFFRAHVEQALYDALSARDLPDGTRGYFHPDNFSFGDPLYLSRLYQAVMAVEGLQSAEVTTFQRWGKQPAGEIAAGVIHTSDVQIVRLDNDPSEQEHGRLVLHMRGGK